MKESKMSAGKSTIKRLVEYVVAVYLGCARFGFVFVVVVGAMAVACYWLAGMATYWEPANHAVVGILLFLFVVWFLADALYKD